MTTFGRRTFHSVGFRELAHLSAAGEGGIARTGKSHLSSFFSAFALERTADEVISAGKAPKDSDSSGRSGNHTYNKLQFSASNYVCIETKRESKAVRRRSSVVSGVGAAAGSGDRERELFNSRLAGLCVDEFVCGITYRWAG